MSSSMISNSSGKAIFCEGVQRAYYGRVHLIIGKIGMSKAGICSYKSQDVREPIQILDNSIERQILSSHTRDY